jgi:hypothetical protein
MNIHSLLKKISFIGRRTKRRVPGAGENVTMLSCTVCTGHQLLVSYWLHNIKKNSMGGTFRADWTDQKCIKSFRSQTLKETDRLKCLDLNGKTTLQQKSVNRIQLAQEGDQWQVFANAVMSLKIPWQAGESLAYCTAVSFSRELGSIPPR